MHVYCLGFKLGIALALVVFLFVWIHMVPMEESCLDIRFQYILLPKRSFRIKASLFMSQVKSQLVHGLVLGPAALFDEITPSKCIARPSTRLLIPSGHFKKL